MAGGTSAVGTDTKLLVDGLLAGNGGVASLRWSGDDRYETAAVVAANALEARWCDLDVIGVATGADFPDALGGGAACGSVGGMLLLTRPDGLPDSVATLLEDVSAGIASCEVYGGTAAIQESVRTAVEALLP